MGLLLVRLTLQKEVQLLKYKKVKYVDLELSEIVYGCASNLMNSGGDATEILDAAFAAGINTFDTAIQYGASEISLANWIEKRNVRDKIAIITKGCHPEGDVDRVTPEDLSSDIEESLERLRTNHIDIYFLHRDDLKVDVGPIVETLNEYHRKGKIGAFGGSNWTRDRIELANKYARKNNLVPFTVSSPNFGIANQLGDPWGGGAGSVTISGPSNKEVREWYVRNNISVFAFSSLGRGMFSGKVKSDDMEGAKNILDEFAIKGYYYPENFERLERVEKLAKEKNCTVPQIAIAWILNQEIEVFPLINTSRPEGIISNIEATNIKLTKKEVLWLDLQDN